MELIKLEHIQKSYGIKKKTTALCDFSLCINKGEMLAIMGKSGSGKSTVLNIISGIDRFLFGKYLFEETDMSKKTGDKMTVFRRDNIGFVHQHFALIEDYSVFHNIALPLSLKNFSKSETEKRVKEVAEELDIKGLLKQHPKELSGGEAQRVAIARAIINNPKVILADEPTGALDEANGKRIMRVFQKLHEKGNTLLLVTHDKNVAAMCERTVEIRDGRNFYEGKDEIND